MPALPAELWIEIFRLVALNRDNTYDWKPCYKDLAAIALTCRSFNWLATPLLYRAVCKLEIKKAQGVDLFLRTLQEKPSLAAHCRHFSLKQDHYQVFNIALRDILCSLTDTRSLEIAQISAGGGFSHLVAKAINQMPKLECLSMATPLTCLTPIKAVCDLIDEAGSLKALHLCNLRWCHCFPSVLGFGHHTFDKVSPV